MHCRGQGNVRQVADAVGRDPRNTRLPGRLRDAGLSSTLSSLNISGTGSATARP